MPLSNYDPGQDLASIDFQAMIGGPLIAVIEAQAQAANTTVDFIKTVGFTPDVEDPVTFEVTPGSPVYVSFKYPKQVAPYQAAGNGNITSIPIASGGTNYATATVSISGDGTGASAAAIISSGVITDINIVDGGSGYTTATVTITGTPNPSTTITPATVDPATFNNDPAVPAQFQDMALEVPLLTMVPIPYIKVDQIEIDFHAKINSMESKTVGSQFKASAGYSSTNNLKLNIQGKGGSLSYERAAKFSASFSYQRASTAGHKIEKTYQLGVKVQASQDEMPGGMETILGILEDAIVSQPVI